MHHVSSVLNSRCLALYVPWAKVRHICFIAIINSHPIDQLGQDESYRWGSRFLRVKCGALSSCVPMALSELRYRKSISDDLWIFLNWSVPWLFNIILYFCMGNWWTFDEIWNLPTPFLTQGNPSPPWRSAFRQGLGSDGRRFFCAVRWPRSPRSLPTPFHPVEGR